MNTACSRWPPGTRAALLDKGSPDYVKGGGIGDVTVWWNRGEHYKELPAGNDLKMANGCPERTRQVIGPILRID